MESATVLHAAFFASEKHRDQRRKNAARTPYINHPLEVAHLMALAGVTDVDVLCAGLLHDTVEDTCTTFDEIATEFGTRVAELVREVTDDKSLPKVERKKLQIEHAAHVSEGAKLIKLADKLSNLSSLLTSTPPSWSPAVVRGYAIWGLTVFQRLRGTNLSLEAQLNSVFEGIGVDPCMTDKEREAELQAYYSAIAGDELFE